MLDCYFIVWANCAVLSLYAKTGRVKLESSSFEYPVKVKLALENRLDAKGMKRCGRFYH